MQYKRISLLVMVGLAGAAFVRSAEPTAPTLNTTPAPAVVSAPPSSAARVQAAYLFAAARQLYLQNRLAEARLLLDRADKLVPGDPSVIYLGELVQARERVLMALQARVSQAAGLRAPMIPQQVVTVPSFGAPGAGLIGGGGLVGGGIGGGLGGNVGGLGGGSGFGGDIARVAVAPSGAGGFGGVGSGGIHYVTIPTPTLYSQSIARQFFYFGGLP